MLHSYLSWRVCCIIKHPFIFHTHYPCRREHSNTKLNKPIIGRGSRTLRSFLLEMKMGKLRNSFLFYFCLSLEHNNGIYRLRFQQSFKFIASRPVPHGSNKLCVCVCLMYADCAMITPTESQPPTQISIQASNVTSTCRISALL